MNAYEVRVKELKEALKPFATRADAIAMTAKIIITLEAQKSAIWDQYQAAVTSIDTLEARLKGMATLVQKRTALIDELKADIPKLEASVEHLDAMCHTRDERIATLGATVDTCAEELTKAKARIHELEKWPGL